MSYQKICTLDDVWEGEMMEYTLGAHKVLLVGIPGGDVRAYQAVCPHQDIPLCEGGFDGRVIVCRAHQWEFDANTGLGVNPSDCKLAQYPIRIDGDAVMIDVEGVKPVYAHT
jgi:toluene monooxygenase system ferredoxin subunit